MYLRLYSSHLTSISVANSNLIIYEQTSHVSRVCNWRDPNIARACGVGSTEGSTVAWLTHRVTRCVDLPGWLRTLCTLHATCGPSCFVFCQIRLCVYGMYAGVCCIQHWRTCAIVLMIALITCTLKLCQVHPSSTNMNVLEPLLRHRAMTSVDVVWETELVTYI